MREFLLCFACASPPSWTPENPPRLGSACQAGDGDDVDGDGDHDSVEEGGHDGVDGDGYDDLGVKEGGDDGEGDEGDGGCCHLHDPVVDVVSSPPLHLVVCRSSRPGCTNVIMRKMIIIMRMMTMMMRLMIMMMRLMIMMMIMMIMIMMMMTRITIALIISPAAT